MGGCNEFPIPASAGNLGQLELNYLHTDYKYICIVHSDSLWLCWVRDCINKSNIYPQIHIMPRRFHSSETVFHVSRTIRRDWKHEFSCLRALISFCDLFMRYGFGDGFGVEGNGAKLQLESERVFGWESDLKRFVCLWTVKWGAHFNFNYQLCYYKS